MNASPTTSTNPLRVLILDEPQGWWTAVCLDRYMVGEGKSEEAALLALHRMVASEFVYQYETSSEMPRDLLGHLPKAPDDYWEMYNAMEGPPKEVSMPPVIVKSMETAAVRPKRRRPSKRANTAVPLEVPFHAQARYAAAV